MIIRCREDAELQGIVLQSLDSATQKGILGFDAVQWDGGNLDHATEHGVSAEEIEQAISNTT